MTREKGCSCKGTSNQELTQVRKKEDKRRDAEKVDTRGVGHIARNRIGDDEKRQMAKRGRDMRETNGQGIQGESGRIMQQNK